MRFLRTCIDYESDDDHGHDSNRRLRAHRSNSTQESLFQPSIGQPYDSTMPLEMSWHLSCRYLRTAKHCGYQVVRRNHESHETFRTILL
jgi:hypothetical protein